MQSIIATYPRKLLQRQLYHVFIKLQFTVMA